MCSNSPLSGKTILVTRPKAQAAPFAESIQTEGGIPIVLPSTEIAPAPYSRITDQLQKAPKHYDWWLFTSANGIDHFFEFLDQYSGKPTIEDPPKLAAVGNKTAQKLKEKGFTPHFTPSKADGATLGAELPVEPGNHCLLPRGNLGTEDLPKTLRQRGANVDELTVYQTQTCEILETEVSEKLQMPLDAVTFTSPSSAKVLAERLANHQIQLSKVAYFCIGETTARTARSLGFAPLIIARHKSMEGMIEEMKDYYTNSSRKQDI